MYKRRCQYGDPIYLFKHCRSLIQRTRQLFPKMKAMGWLALSPRWKPSKSFNSVYINEMNRKFNELLITLSNEMNFDIIHANLQHQHMHQDGLHPSIQSGRILIEKAIYNWFTRQTKKISNLKNDKSLIPSNMRPINPTTDRNDIYNVNNHNAHYQNANYNNYNRNVNNRNVNNRNVKNQNVNNRNVYNQNDNNRNVNNRNVNNQNDNNRNVNYRNANSYNRNVNINNKNINYNASKTTSSYSTGKTLIPKYPHFLRHKQEYFRKAEIPTELENKKKSYSL